MKKLFFVCLMAGSQSLFAQNINLSELETLLSKNSLDSFDNLLLSKGFQKAKIQGGASVRGFQLKEGWYFRGDSGPDAAVITNLSRLVDTSGRSFLSLETSNPFFYSHLMNQMTENSFSYKETVPKEKEASLVFTNNKHEIMVTVSSELKLRQQYQLRIGEAISEIAYFFPRKKVTKVGAVKKAAPVKKAVPKAKKRAPY